MTLLTDAQVKKAAPGEKPRRLYDERGLYVEIAPSGGKWWRLKYRYGGKEKLLSLGTYPDTTLAMARAKRDDARRLLASGVDPSAARKAEKASRVAAVENGFEAVAREWYATVHQRKVTASHALRTLTRLEQDIFPTIGGIRIADVSAPVLLAALRKIEARGAIETAHRAKQACGQVFRYAIATGRAERDPTADLKDALQPVLVKHMPAITDPKQVGEMLRTFDSYQGQPVTRAALALAPLVFARPGELRHAEWAEIDLADALWAIPSTKLKRTKQQKASGASHLVPLARQAVEILRELHGLTGHGRYVFPSQRTGERPMSDNAILAALRRMGFDKEELTGHGMRAMARTMMVERLGIHEQVIEAQLAHSVKDSLGRAYNRTEFLEQRRQMMQQWADYLDTLREGASVKPFKAA